MVIATHMSEEDLKKAAPAIFQEHAHRALSERYAPVSTLEAIKTLERGGWRPVSAEQKRSRNAAGSVYAKHLIRFRHVSAQPVLKGGISAVGQAFPEIVLVNSHNGTSCYRLLAGLHVLACTNGLIVAEETLGSVIVRHLKGNQELLLSAAEKISINIKPIVARVDAMRRTKLDDKARKFFARSALKIKFPHGAAPFTADELLQPRRESDKRNDLWATFNVVQENFMAGGVKGKTESGRRFTSLPVRDINVKVNANQALWNLADKFLVAKEN